jgi:hypothetical protein
MADTIAAKEAHQEITIIEATQKITPAKEVDL